MRGNTQESGNQNIKFQEKLSEGDSQKKTVNQATASQSMVVEGCPEQNSFYNLYNSFPKYLMPTLSNVGGYDPSRIAGFLNNGFLNNGYPYNLLQNNLFFPNQQKVNTILPQNLFSAKSTYLNNMSTQQKASSYSFANAVGLDQIKTNFNKFPPFDPFQEMLNQSPLWKKTLEAKNEANISENDLTFFFESIMGSTEIFEIKYQCLKSLFEAKKNKHDILNIFFKLKIDNHEPFFQKFFAIHTKELLTCLHELTSIGEDEINQRLCQTKHSKFRVFIMLIYARQKKLREEDYKISSIVSNHYAGIHAANNQTDQHYSNETGSQVNPVQVKGLSFFLDKNNSRSQKNTSGSNQLKRPEIHLSTQPEGIKKVKTIVLTRPSNDERVLSNAVNSERICDNTILGRSSFETRYLP